MEITTKSSISVNPFREVVWCVGLRRAFMMILVSLEKSSGDGFGWWCWRFKPLRLNTKAKQRPVTT
jgi:hypothetical protein